MLEVKIVMDGDVRAALLTIAEAINRGSNCMKCVEAVAGAAKAEVPSPDPTPVPETTAPAETATPAAGPAEEPEEHTFEQIQKKVAEIIKTSPEKKAKVKAALNKFSKTLSGIPKDKYSEFWAALEAL